MELKKNTEIYTKKVRGNYENKIKELKNELNILHTFVEELGEVFKANKMSINSLRITIEKTSESLNSNPSENVKRISRILADQKEVCESIEKRNSGMMAEQRKLARLKNPFDHLETSVTSPINSP